MCVPLSEPQRCCEDTETCFGQNFIYAGVVKLVDTLAMNEKQTILLFICFEALFDTKCSVCGSGGMVDALGLGPSGVTRGGSSPLSRTVYSL